MGLPRSASLIAARTRVAGSLLINNVLVVDAEAAPFRGWVLVHGRHIEQVGAGAPPDRPRDQIVDGRGWPLMPGLVNAHAHSHSTLTRGTAENLPLEEWLPRIFKEVRGMTDELAYQAGLVSYAEALLSGTTCIVDMCVNPEAASRAAERLGIRVVLAPYVGDRIDFAPSLSRTEALIRRFAHADSRVQVWVGLHEAESSSDAQIREAVTMARHYGVGIHTHCSETQAAEAATKSRTGMSQLAHFDSLGAVGSRTLLAHCVWLSGEDQDILLRRGAHVAHCPQSNLKLGSGIAPIPRFHTRGINVALGSDGAKANNGLDQFDAMKFASLLPKGVACDAAVLPADDVFRMATRGGAKALGLDSGVIAPGRKADLVLLRGDRVHLQPVIPQAILTNLVHAARGGDVDTVWVDGQMVVENGELKALPQAELAFRASEAAEQLLAL
jgi:5-methylthioadenosine/S-adenosylhomocysteine deaminase